MLVIMLCCTAQKFTYYAYINAQYYASVLYTLCFRFPNYGQKMTGLSMSQDTQVEHVTGYTVCACINKKIDVLLEQPVG